MPELASSSLIPTNIEGQYARTPSQSAIENARYAQYREMIVEANEKGWNPATVINISPFTLNPSGVLLRGLRIAAVPRDKERWAANAKLKLRSGLEIPYVMHVIPNPEHCVLEQVVGTGESDFQGMIKNKTWWPMDLAKDVVAGNNNNETKGGVFCYKGDHVPLTLEVTSSDESGLLEASYFQMINYLTAKFDEAEQAFASRNEKLIKHIRDYHRWATMYLRMVGVLERDPEWLTQILTTTARAPIYCTCGQECPPKAIRCGKCNYILDPYRGFKEGVFDLETPGGVTSLRRLTKVQLRELGVYPLVKPMDEYLRELQEQSKIESKKNKGGGE